MARRRRVLRHSASCALLTLNQFRIQTVILVFFMAAMLNPAFSQTVFPMDKAADIYFRYEVSIPAFEDDSKEFKLWVPFPIDTSFQKVTRFSVQSPWPGEVIQEETHQNRFLYFKQPTLKRPLKMAFHYRLTIFPHSIFSDTEGKQFYEIYKKLPAPQKEASQECAHRYKNFKGKLFFGFRLTQKLRGSLEEPTCWAMIQNDEQWIPMDIQEEFGKMPANRITLFRGGSVVLPKASNQSPIEGMFKPYAELDGSEFQDIQAQWSFTRIKTYLYKP